MRRKKLKTWTYPRNEPKFNQHNSSKMKHQQIPIILNNIMVEAINEAQKTCCPTILNQEKIISEANHKMYHKEI